MTDVTEAVFAILLFPGGLFVLTLGLLLKGVDRKVVARLQRRVGPPLYQPALDIIKLLTKETLIPDTANELAFRLAPVLGLTGMLVTAALMPIGGVWNGVSGLGDLLVLLYLLPIPAMGLMLAGGSSSSPYGSLGFSREMCMMFAYEMPLIASFLAVAVRVGGASGSLLSLPAIMDYQFQHGPLLFDPVMLPAALALILFIPGTMGHGLFDIPEAEPEVIEGPLLEYSGPLLAVFHLMSAVKLVVVLELGVALLFPNPLVTTGGGGVLVNLLWHIMKCLVLLMVSVTCFRAATGRLRLDQGFSFFVKYTSPLALVSLGLAFLLR
ncbi:NADH-quinone oxidoreductase subunit H [Humidesulfovibrio mexicanus]|uniref:NADH-quinone oxidoreductase subunit H n=1 Tax=Humidesulfovibrio mexicanus TaxID=147047 RepID=A0A238YFK0_9BACT|nr:NADH-quinone oxidoreductase subunit H [Humidesulfovibrio mexicanus]SNR69840.1 NADH-quinone oxidoreductase subunit H [Humidesulfovibrio mexicanus]